MRRHVTLVLCTILHAFTHGYATMLVPLYLLVQKDLNLPGVASVSRIVTVYGIVYFLGSYLAGILADRFDRKWLLGLGLLLNATAILLMGCTHDYPLLITLAVVAGVAGTIFHPAANALVPAHYPEHPGMAIGLLGIGSGLGFWVGPWFAGQRVAAATWQVGHVSDWQRPLIEAGVAGLIVGVLFLLIAHDPRNRVQDRSSIRNPKSTVRKRLPLGRDLTRRTLAVAFVLGFRDMAGVASLSLIAIYLLKAFNQPAKQVGYVVGTMMLAATVINPLLVYFTTGRRRLPALTIILLLGGVTIASLPHWPLAAVLPIMCGFMTLQLGSYAVSDAAMLERVSSEHRGRVTGLFLIWAGTFSSTGPWIMGWWTDHFGERATDPHAYTWPFLTMAACMGLAALSPPLIAKLGRVGVSPPIEPITEISPATMSAVG